jgi:hypothetical protein
MKISTQTTLLLLYLLMFLNIPYTSLPQFSSSPTSLPSKHLHPLSLPHSPFHPSIPHSRRRKRKKEMRRRTK